MSIGLRNKRIDLIRGVSILLVLFHHFNIAYRLDDTALARVFGWEAVRAVARNGNYGVTMFFVVSGFLITLNARRRWGELGQVGARAFYSLRAARILPCLLLLLLVVDALALAGFRVFQNRPPEGGDAGPVPYWLSHLAALTSWMNVLVGRAGWFSYPLGVLWSLSVEEAFYLAFPLACLVLRTEARLAAFWAVFIVLGPAWRLAHQGEEAAWLYAYLACFDGIAIGCCTALLAKRVTLQGRAAATLQIAVAAGLAFLYLWRPIAQTNVLGVTSMAVGTAVLLLGAHGNSTGSVLERNRARAALGWLGRLSYELYLFHLVVLGGMRAAFPARVVVGDGKLLLLAAYLALSGALAALVSRYYAEPLNRGLRRLLASRIRPA